MKNPIQMIKQCVGEGGTLLRAERAGRMCVGCHRDLL